MAAGYRIGIISDTHGLLRPEVTETLKGCDAILHGGDIDRQEILDQLGRIAPVYAVRGNNDGEWAEQIPETLTVRLGGLTFFMIHNRKMIAQDVSGADVVLYGHSHRYEEEPAGGQLWLNPGSCGPGRFIQPVTMAVLAIGADGSCQTERVDLSRKGGIAARRVTARRSAASAGGIWTEVSGSTAVRQDSGIPGRAGDSPSGAGPEEDGMKIPANVQELIPLVIKEMNRGRPIAEIARRTGLSYDLAEQICRIYVTHPGVDLEGILRRLGL